MIYSLTVLISGEKLAIRIVHNFRAPYRAIYFTKQAAKPPSHSGPRLLPWQAQLFRVYATIEAERAFFRLQ